MRLALYLPLLLASQVIHAACEVESGHFSGKLSDSAVAARNSFYVAECIRAGGTLVNVTDPTLKGRLERPSGISGLPPPNPAWSQLGIRAHITTPVLVAYVIDVHGAVENVTVLESSGNQKYDALTAEYVRQFKWKKPAELDGVPVAALVIARVQRQIR